MNMSFSNLWSCHTKPILFSSKTRRFFKSLYLHWFLRTIFIIELAECQKWTWNCHFTFLYQTKILQWYHVHVRSHLSSRLLCGKYRGYHITMWQLVSDWAILKCDALAWDTFSSTLCQGLNLIRVWHFPKHTLPWAMAKCAWESVTLLWGSTLDQALHFELVPPIIWNCEYRSGRIFTRIFIPK